MVVNKLWTPALALALAACSAGASLTQEQADALDRFEITELMYRYAVTHNSSDIEGYADLFTEDAVLYDRTMDYEFARGREGIIKAAESDRDHFNPEAKSNDGKLHLGKLRHIITNPVVTLHGDGTASGICYAQIIANKPDFGPVLLSQGYYRDEYVKQDGKWLISKRDFYILDWSNWGLAKELGLTNGPVPGQGE